MPISKKGCSDLVCVLADKFQKAQRKLGVTTRQLAQRKGKIGELELEALLLTHDFVEVGD